MSNTNTGGTKSNSYSNTSSSSNTTSNWSSKGGSSGCSGTGKNGGCGTATAAKTGTTYNVNEIPTAGCYVCNWNGSLLRVGTGCFSSSGNAAFSFACSDDLTVTYLGDDPTASLETCRNQANSASVYSNF